MKDLTRYALIDSLGTSLYVIFIASFIYFMGQSFPGPNNTVLIPIAMLLLFVFSAAFTGILVFGRPVMFYLDGKKKEAMSLLLYTLGIFFIVTLAAFFLLVLLIG